MVVLTEPRIRLIVMMGFDGVVLPPGCIPLRSRFADPLLIVPLRGEGEGIFRTQKGDGPPPSPLLEEGECAVLKEGDLAGGQV